MVNSWSVNLSRIKIQIQYILFHINSSSTSNQLIGVDEDSVLCRKRFINIIPLLANVSKMNWIITDQRPRIKTEWLSIYHLDCEAWSASSGYRRGGQRWRRASRWARSYWGSTADLGRVAADPFWSPRTSPTIISNNQWMILGILDFLELFNFHIINIQQYCTVMREGT